ncbi:MAG: 2-dehydropantoate 2-reductase [Rhodospirillaceae bacterium]|nr:2-dehydropantoate 2-reductase [Rhodospirillaceae bacterium]
MKVCVVGAGGVGGCLGARLAAAGHDVAFIARGDHLRTLRQDGLRLVSDRGDVALDRVTATDDPAEVGPVGLVLFTVKMRDCADAAAACRPLIGAESVVLPLLNGVESHEILRDVLGPAPVLGGTAYISAVIDRPGVIRQTGAFERILFGELGGEASARVQQLESVLSGAGIGAAASDRILAEIWEKFILLATNAGVTTVTRLPIGILRDCAGTRRLIDLGMREVEAVARAAGIDVAADIVDRHRDFYATLPAEMRSSMQVDLDRGRPLELPWLSGAVVRLGVELGIPTPVHEVIALALAPFADGAPVPAA